MCFNVVSCTNTHIFYIHAYNLTYMGVSKNRGTSKWMVKVMEIPIRMDDLGGKPTIFGNTHILWKIFGYHWDWCPWLLTLPKLSLRSCRVTLGCGWTISAWSDCDSTCGAGVQRLGHPRVGSWEWRMQKLNFKFIPTYVVIRWFPTIGVYGQKKDGL